MGERMLEVEKTKWFEDCFRQNYQSLCYFAYNYLKDKYTAEDIVQNVFMKLLDKSLSFKDYEHVKLFLYKSVRNACINEVKLTKIHTDILSNIQENKKEDENDFFNKIIRSEVYTHIIKAIEELPLECGRVFKLAYLEQMDNEEIAQKLSISVNTVKVQKNNAKKRLREKLKHTYYVLLFLFPGLRNE